MSLEAALAFIRRRGSARTPEIAAELGIGEVAADDLLEPAHADGRLVTCTVSAGGRQVIEYRCSTAGQNVNLRDATWRARQANAAAAFSRGATVPPPPRGPSHEAQAAAPITPKGDSMSVREKVEAALLAHGPMDVRSLAKHVKDTNHLSTIVAQLARDGVLKKLGGGTRSTIYGTPSQKLDERKSGDALERGAELGRNSAAPKAKRKAGKRGKRLARTSRIPAPATPSPAAKRKGGFRPAIAADGAIIFLGAKRGDFEVQPVDVRAVLNLSRRLTPTELTETLAFIERLDKAEVAA